MSKSNKEKEEMIVLGGTSLKGTVKIEGAKNSVLTILAATLLAEEDIVTLKNVPIIDDIFTMIQIMRHLNVCIDFNEKLNEMRVDATKSLLTEAMFEEVSIIRKSITIMGPLLARKGHVKMAMPGGCTIGKRPIDLHLKGFQAMGAKVTHKSTYIEVNADELTGATILLDFPSVGATENIIMAAVKALGTTVIRNAAKEPEIVDLSNFLNKMGAKIVGAGTEVIRIEGVQILCGVSHVIMQDRIEAGTFMVAAAMTQGNILIKDAVLEHNHALINKLIETGATITTEHNGIRIIGPKVLKPTHVKSMPYPGFPTDLQAQITALLTITDGTSTVTENIFENRFQHLKEMSKMNADVKVVGNTAIIEGRKFIRGALVEAMDLRSTAALILLGLCANGVTRVTNLKYLDRGYYRFYEKLQKLGANVCRITE